MESLLVSTGVVALAEIGDKTQLLAFLLAARFKKPLPIIAGIFIATIFNHGLAAWTLVPDKIEEDETNVASRFGVFGATLVTFFLAEMGDKTQVATVAM